MRKTIYFLAMLLLTAIVGFFAAEIVTRIFCPQQGAISWVEPNVKYGFINKKNFYTKYSFPNSDFTMEVKTNSLGLRDNEYDFSRSDVEKILLLGDSFVFGHGVNIEDHFDTKLEDLLSQSGENFKVINAGVNGWGTLQEITYAKDHFELFNPDIIVITFCGNDPWDDAQFKHKMVDLEKGVIRFPGKLFLRKHSHLYRFIFLRYHELVHRWVLRKKIVETNKGDEDIADENIVDEDIKIDKQIDKQSSNIVVEEGWKATLEYIRNFHNDFLKFKPDGVLLLQATNPIDTNISEHLSSLSNGKNLIYVDLYDDAKILLSEQMSLPYDDHWSPSMHSISAKNLYKIILELKMNNKKM